MWSQDTLQELAKYELILGSSSPRRKEILAQNLGLRAFSVVTSSFEENLSKHGIAPAEYVTKTAQHKIESIVAQLEDNKKYILIVADTIVCCDGEIYEKPETIDRQLEMLKNYRKVGQVDVMTSVHVCIVDGGHLATHNEKVTKTVLKFNTQLTDEQLQLYASTGEGAYVAGGFKYQEKGSMLFIDLSGDYFNVVGLPVYATFELVNVTLNENK